jgi:hypothetical protein
VFLILIPQQKTKNAQDMDLNWITEGMVRTMWHYLEEKPVTVTAFYFLDHFNAHFEPPGLKRRIINEIIVQAQGGKQKLA